MAIALTSWEIQDQSRAHDKHTLDPKDTLYRDSLPFSSRCFAEFNHDPRSSSRALSSVDDLQQQQRFTGTGKRIFFPGTAVLSPGASAGVSSELAHIMQGRVGSYPASQHLPTVHESFGRELSGDYDSLAFNELSGFWGDLRPLSQDLATYAVLPPQKLGWNEGSTSCCPTGDPVSTKISSELHRPSGKRSSCSYPIPTIAETSALEGIDLECPRPLEPENNHLPWPVKTSLTSVGFGSTISSRSIHSEDNCFPQAKSGHQTEILEKTLCTPPQSACQKSGFQSQSQSQSLARGPVQGVTGVGHFSDGVHDSKVNLDSRQYNFLHQGPSVSMPSSPDLHGRHHRGECNTGGKPHQFRSENLRDRPELKKNGKELPFEPRKYQRRRMRHGNTMKDEATSFLTPLDHIQRERQRRDLMASKIAALELLLPKSSKRDRVSVVYDAIHLLRRLEREVKDLQKRFDAKKLLRASLAPSAGHRQSLDPGKVSVPISTNCNMRTSGNCFSNEVIIKRLGTYMKPIDVLTQPTWGTSAQSRPTQRSAMISSVRQIREQEDIFVEFHIHLDSSVRVQQENLLKCRCGNDYLSTMLGLVNEFQLDVSTCNIVKLSGYFICVVGLKTRTGKETITAAQFAVRLKVAVDVDIAREAILIDRV